MGPTRRIDDLHRVLTDDRIGRNVRIEVIREHGRIEISPQDRAV